MEAKSPEYLYIYFSDEESIALRKAAKVLFELGNSGFSDDNDSQNQARLFDNKFEIQCLDDHYELERTYNDTDIYNAYLMLGTLSEDILRYRLLARGPRNKEESENGN